MIDLSYMILDMINEKTEERRNHERESTRREWLVSHLIGESNVRQFISWCNVIQFFCC